MYRHSLGEELFLYVLMVPVKKCPLLEWHCHTLLSPPTPRQEHVGDKGQGFEVGLGAKCGTIGRRECLFEFY